MSIYIKGMDLPTDCSSCPMCYDMMQCVVADPIIDFWSKSEQDFDFCTERHPRCPLGPVPDHGDLIDRDEYVVKLRLKRARCGVGYTSNAITMCMKDANDMPTIIPADSNES